VAEAGGVDGEFSAVGVGVGDVVAEAAAGIFLGDGVSEVLTAEEGAIGEGAGAGFPIAEAGFGFVVGILEFGAGESGGDALGEGVVREGWGTVWQEAADRGGGISAFGFLGFFGAYLGEVSGDVGADLPGGIEGIFTEAMGFVIVLIQGW
jgi:hypothetical protein